jgi:hypothetical protein
MLPLSGESFPTTSQELVAAIKRGFGEQGIKAQSVEARGGRFPKIESLTLDLTGARGARDLRIPSLDLASGVERLETEKFELRAEPLYFEDAPFELHVQASRAAFSFGGTPGEGMLVLNDAEEGSLSLSSAIKDLEGLIHEILVELAGKQGVEVRETRLELKSQGPRTLSFRGEVTAKMFIMTAALTLSGQIDVDAGLNARFSGLTLSGDGMITKIANGFIRPKLDALEGRVIPLLAFSLGDLRLRDVEVSAGKNLLIRAAFGSG